jgi:hypothetical protein
MNDLDDLLLAQQLFAQHGAQAAFAAQRNHDRLVFSTDFAASARWLHIKGMIEDMALQDDRRAIDQIA